MKFLAKINRGLILTVVIVAAIAIYLIAQSISQADEKPKIKDVCQQYINTAISYSQLPENYRKANPEIPQAELDKYIADMSKDLKAFYTDKEETYKGVIERNKEYLENQAKGVGVVYSYTKEIKEYENFVFDGDTVTVSIGTNSVFDGSDISSPLSPRGKVTGKTVDTITLQKVDGEWKVIYAFLEQPVKPKDNQTITYRLN